MKMLMISLLATAATGCRHEPDIQSLPPFTRYSIDNGLDVVLMVDRRLPLVTVDLTFHVGTNHDGHHKGLAQLVENIQVIRASRLTDSIVIEEISSMEIIGEEMALQGLGPPELDENDFPRILSFSGMANPIYEVRENPSKRLMAAAQSSHTYTTHTSFQTTVAREHLPAILWLESRRMRDAADISGDDIQLAINRMAKMWSLQIEADRAQTLFLAVEDVFFPPSHPQFRARPRKKSWLDARMARDFARRYYGPYNATLVLAGDLPDDIHQQIHGHFSRCCDGRLAWGSPESGSPLNSGSPPQFESAIVAPGYGATSAVIMAWIVPGVLEAGSIEADVLAEILDNDRLQSLVQIYDPYIPVILHALHLNRVGQSVFMIIAEYDDDDVDVDGVVEMLDIGVAQFYQHLPTIADIRQARNRLAVESEEHLRGIDSVVRLTQSNIALGKPPTWTKTIQLESVTEKSMSQFIRQHVSIGRRITVLIPSNPRAF